MKAKSYVHIPSGGVAELVSPPGPSSSCYTLRWETGAYAGREIKYTAATFSKEFRERPSADSLGDGRKP
jgi:hypothetical protein